MLITHRRVSRWDNDVWLIAWEDIMKKGELFLESCTLSGWRHSCYSWRSAWPKDRTREQVKVYESKKNAISYLMIKKIVAILSPAASIIFAAKNGVQSDWGSCTLHWGEQTQLCSMAGVFSACFTLLDIYFPTLSGWHLLATEKVVEGDKPSWWKEVCVCMCVCVWGWKKMETRGVFVPQLISA